MLGYGSLFENVILQLFLYPITLWMFLHCSNHCSYGTTDDPTQRVGLHTLKSFSNVEPIMMRHYNGTHNGTVIFLPNVGRFGEAWESRMNELRNPDMKVVISTPPLQRVAFRNGQEILSWCNFFDKNTINFDDRNRTIADSIEYIHTLIRREISAGAPSNKIFLVGFSQGAAIALHSALSYNKRLGGVVAVSSWEPNEKVLSQYFDHTNKDIPVMQCYIDTDPFTSPQSVNATYKILKHNYTQNIDFRKYPVVGLTLEDVLRDVKAFFTARLAEESK